MKAALIALALLVVDCAGPPPPAPDPAARAHDAAIKSLNGGQVESLPTGALYVRFVSFGQPPGYVINSKQHVPSIVFVLTGVHRLVLAGEAPIDLVAGQAKFHQSVTHTHLNPGSEQSTWFSIALWPNSARGQPLVDPIANAAFESDDVDRAELPQVPYSEVLREVTLDRLGTAGAHRFGGLVAFYVLSGSLTIRSAHRSPRTLTADQGAAFPPEVDLQESNSGAGKAVFLEFITNPIGRDFETPLLRPPAA